MFALSIPTIALILLHIVSRYEKELYRFHILKRYEVFFKFRLHIVSRYEKELERLQELTKQTLYLKEQFIQLATQCHGNPCHEHTITFAILLILYVMNIMGTLQ
jgi:hypothetical protein